MKAIVYIFSGLLLFVLSCSEIIKNNTNPLPVYTEIISVNLPDNYSIKLYTSGSDSLTYGYNDIFFKVWLNSNEQNTGYIKVYPKMRMTAHITHSTPVSDSFAYNISSGYYSGYVIFNMPTTPPDLIWKTRFTYIDNNGSGHEKDSVPIYTSYRAEKQLKIFYDLFDTVNYTLTLVKPFAPIAGLNDLVLLLHRSDEYELYYEQITEAYMHINVYKQDSLQSTNGNTDPVNNGDGYYRGKINMPYSGVWIVGDTIYYNGRIITNNPPPLPAFIFDVE